MVRLSLTFYMGAALIPVAQELAAALGQRLDTTVGFDPHASDATRRRALDQAPPGIVWLCGLETIVRQDDGRLPASIVGRPIFLGRDAPVYESVVVATQRWAGSGLADLYDARLAINQAESWSGHHALRAEIVRRDPPQPIVKTIVETGSHEASIDALLGGHADVAAIDETVWGARLARDPEAAKLRAIDRTAPRPAPPFSLVDGLDAGLGSALREALLTAPVQGLEGIVPASDVDYAVFRDDLTASRSLPWPSP